MSRATLHTDICDFFGIEYPVLLAGMGGVAMSDLVAAVSNAGGLGVLGAATLDPEGLRREIHRIRQLTDKPFAVDLLAPIPDFIRGHMKVLFEERVEIFVAGLAVPDEFVADMKANGMKIVVMTGKVRHALKAESAGADVVVAQGTEAGGHTGEIGGMALVPQVVDAVSIPVLAAGGICDGRGVAAALALGASGVVIGTRFVATKEAQAAPSYQKAIVEAAEDATLRTRCYTGKPARTIRNRYSAEWEDKKDQLQPYPAQMLYSARNNLLDFGGVGGDIDPERCFMPAGQGLGMIESVRSAAEVLEEIVAEAAETLRAIARYAGPNSEGV
ncbi:MAG: nitronate monooxygenase [Candidatus Dadabacteria bacterium]|nr:MAG: nitronate monooxygenase [Candidatus Dadabacteria bacterium]